MGESNTRKALRWRFGKEQEGEWTHIRIVLPEIFGGLAEFWHGFALDEYLEIVPKFLKDKGFRNDRFHIIFRGESDDPRFDPHPDFVWVEARGYLPVMVRKDRFLSIGLDWGEKTLLNNDAEMRMDQRVALMVMIPRINTHLERIMDFNFMSQDIYYFREEWDQIRGRDAVERDLGKLEGLLDAFTSAIAADGETYRLELQVWKELREQGLTGRPLLAKDIAEIRGRGYECTAEFLPLLGKMVERAEGDVRDLPVHLEFAWRHPEWLVRMAAMQEAIAGQLITANGWYHLSVGGERMTGEMRAGIDGKYRLVRWL